MTIKNQLYSIITKIGPPGFNISKKAVRKIVLKNPNFTSNVEMATYVDEWVRKFDVQYDLIVGIPRSGLMVASMIATSLAKPLVTPDNILWNSKSIASKPIKNILVIDDCITTGRSMSKAVDKIKILFPQAMIHKGVLFAQEHNKWMVDTYCRTIQDNLFQWNMMHYKMGMVGFDMEGVLCEECSEEMDENKYFKYLNSARSYLIPEYEIDYIITSRPEKYRPQTEKWLNDHAVKYRNLIMWTAPDRPGEDEEAAFKCQIIKRIDIRYFLESDIRQAEEIWNSTKVICLCTDEMRIFD